MKIKLLVEGGEMKPGPTLSQKIGPLGMNIGEIINKINTETKSFKGMKVPVELDINVGTKTFNVDVFSPPVSELIKKEAGAEKGAGEHKKLKAGNISIEQVISIAKTKRGNLLSKDLKSAVKDVVGSCVSLGILVESKEAKEIEQDIDAGVYDKEIRNEKTETSDEKKLALSKYFKDLKDKQEKAIKKAQEEAEAAKAAAEAAKAAAGPVATVAATPAAGATAPTTAAATPAAKTAAPAKAEKGKAK